MESSNTMKHGLTPREQIAEQSRLVREGVEVFEKGVCAAFDEAGLKSFLEGVVARGRKRLPAA